MKANRKIIFDSVPQPKIVEHETSILIPSAELHAQYDFSAEQKQVPND